MNRKSLQVDEQGQAQPAIVTGFAALRKRTGKSQEWFARQLNCSSATVSRWERGKQTPRGKWLLRILELYPGEDVRALFGLQSQISDLQLPPPVQGRGPAADADLLRYFDTAARGLNLLYEAAVVGHLGAKTTLRNEAERLVKRGTEWRHAKYRKVK